MKSTAAGKDRRGIGDQRRLVSGSTPDREQEPEQSKAASNRPLVQAGTQAPPVDPLGIEAAQGSEPHQVSGAPTWPAEPIVGKRGRPRVHPDRKAYKAEKERERRAKAKAIKGPT